MRAELGFQRDSNAPPDLPNIQAGSVLTKSRKCRLRAARPSVSHLSPCDLLVGSNHTSTPMDSVADAPTRQRRRRSAPSVHAGHVDLGNALDPEGCAFVVQEVLHHLLYIKSQAPGEKSRAGLH